MLVGSTDQLEERLRVAQADKQHVEGQEAAGQRVLTRTINEKNKLQDANIKQAEELKDMRAQLSDALKENRKLKGGIFSMLFNLTFIWSPVGKFYEFCFCRCAEWAARRRGVQISRQSVTRAVQSA